MNAPKTKLKPRSADELARELDACRIELKIQNEELRQVKIELEKFRKRHVDFYDLAPVGYLTLNHECMIDEINFTGAMQLGMERGKLLHRHFAVFVDREDMDRWRNHFLSALKHDNRQSCEMALRRGDGSRFFAQMDCMRLKKGGKELAVHIVFIDITARKLAELELEKYKNLVESSGDAIIGKTLDGIIESWNDAAEEIFGYTDAEAIGKPMLMLIPSDRVGEETEILSRISRGERVEHFETVRKSKTGRLLNISTTISPICDVQGRVTGASTIARDITRSKQVEAAQYETSNLLQKIASQVPGVVFQLRLRPDGTSCVPYANEAIREIYRLSPEDVREDACKAFAHVHPDDLENHMVSIRASARDLTPWQQEYRLKFDDGTVRWLFGNALPQREADGSVVWHGFITDITARKQADEKLRLSEAERSKAEEDLQRFFNLIPDLACIASTDGYFLRINLMWQETLGYTNQEILATPFIELVHPDDREATLQEVERQLAGKQITNFINRYHCKDGGYKWLEWRATPAVDGKLLFASARDITARREAETQIANSLSLLQATLESTNDAILVVDLYSTWTLHNQKFVDLWHIPDEIIAARDDNAALSYVLDQLEDAGSFLKKVRELYAAPETSSFDVLKFKDGKIIERYSIPQRIGGKVAGRVWSFRDVTARTRAEKALRESEAFGLSLFNSRLEQVAVLDRQGAIVAVNEAWLRFALENGAPELIGKSIGMNYLDVCARASLRDPASEATGALAGIKAVLSGAQKEFDMEYVCHSPDKQRWFHMRVTPLLSSQGGVLVAHENITQRKIEQEALQKSEARLRSVLDATPFPVAIVDLQDSNFQFWSRSAFTLFGHTAPTAAEWYEMAYPDENYRNEVVGRWKPFLEKARLSAQAVNTGEYRITCRDGSVRICELYATFLTDNLIVTFNDITERKRLEQALRHSEFLFRELFENMSSAVVVYEAVDDGEDFVIRDFNRSAELAESIKREQVIGKRVTGAFPGVKEFGLFAIFQRVWQTGHPEHFPITFYKDERIAGWRDNYIYRINTGEVVAIYDDVTERKRAEEALRIAAITFESQEAIMITDARSNIIRVNHAFSEITGYSPEEVLGKNPSMMKSGRHDKAFYEAMWQQLLNTGSWSGEVWDKRKDGEIYPKWLNITAVKNELNETIQYVAIFSDITERKKAEEEIRSLAFYDALTRLPNRRLFIDRLRAALLLSSRNDKYGAVFFIDLDRFKEINDTHGHECGDLLLIEVATRIKSCVREMDTVARFGGDEFVVLIEDISDDPNDTSYKVGLVAEKIRETLAHPYHLMQHVHHSSPSIGVSLYRGNEEPMDAVLQHADMAMYQAKNAGRNAVRFFDAAMQQNVSARAELLSDLRCAIERRQLHLYYQIQVDNENQPVGAEALLRWIHPLRGIVMPDQFIPIAEESELIHDIGDWVLEEACRQLASWSVYERLRDLTLAVNISARQLVMPDFVGKVACLLEKHRINPPRLKLELTENMVLDDQDGTVERMYALKALGISLSMDGFGTRYSSLSYLKQLPIDQLKIDHDFVQAIAKQGSDAQLVESIIDLANNFSLNVIAEGVETDEQLTLLKHRDCIAYQGFLFSKAVSIEEFEALMGEAA